uniref:Major facilitator superfamily (MFS) profile domain-containing protein n=1 Tax=Panagrolaimus sp. JU765 TaxID=591449 RepID=A0AC34RMF6_9BILA
MTIVAARLMDHNCFGRRILHLIGLSGMFLSTIGIFVSMSLSQSTTYPNLQKFGSIGAVLFVFTYIISFATGPGPIPWFFVSEIFPPHAKSSAQSVAVMSCWIAGSIVGIAFLPINNILGHYSFLIFTAFLGWFIFFTFKHVPETKGKTIEEVERDMGLDIIKQ